MGREIIVKDCKYRLPCNWCDKYNRICEHVEYEILKQQEEENIGKQNPCNHNWVTEKAEAVTKEEAGYVTYYTSRCSICGKKRIKRVEVDGNHHFDVAIYEGEKYE